MWKLRLITGPKAGEVFPLHEGENLIGRSPTCTIVIPSAGISKNHCKIQVKGNALRISDLKSSNGTFLNGLKIEDSILQVGDKVSFHDVLAEVQYVVPNFQHNSYQQTTGSSNHGSAAEDLYAEESFDPSSPSFEANEMDENSEAIAPPKSLQDSLKLYLDNVLMPGVYKLGQWMEFKVLLFSFILLFIVIVTALSVIPMLKITQDSIERESSRRALGIARSLVNINQNAIRTGFQSQLSTRFAEKEEGVKVALIISASDGSVLAPANQIGSYKNVEFIHTARKIDEEYTNRVDSSLIGASVPIRYYDPNTGNYDIRAYAVVLYNMGSLAIDDGRTISLFVQTLLLAIALGSLVFFFMYKLIERPYHHLIQSIDENLAGESHSLEPEFQFPVLKKLYTNINSILNQNLGGGSNSEAMHFESIQDIQSEAENLVRIVENPAFCLDSNENILSMNQGAESLFMESAVQVQSQNYSALNDESLKLSIQDLLERLREENHLIHSNELEFGGTNMEIDAQAFRHQDQIRFIFFSIKEKMGGF